MALSPENYMIIVTALIWRNAPADKRKNGVRRDVSRAGAVAPRGRDIVTIRIFVDVAGLAARPRRDPRRS
jgi:hypothetical protein